MKGKYNHHLELGTRQTIVILRPYLVSNPAILAQLVILCVLILRVIFAGLPWASEGQ